MNTENVSSTTSNDDGVQASLPDPSSYPEARIQQRGQISWGGVRSWLVGHTFVSSWLPTALRPWFMGYLMAIVLQILAVLLIGLIMRGYPAFSFVEAPVLFAVLLVSLIWGSGPGILAVLVGALLLVLLTASPYFTIGFRRLDDGVSIVLYLVIGLMIGFMASQMRRERTNALNQQKGVETSRQQLYDLFRQVPTPISVLRGPDHRFEFVNPLTQRAIGKREVLGKPIREAFPEYGAQGIFHLLDQVYTTGEPLTIQELRAETMHYEDGPPMPIERYFNVMYQPLHSERGVVDGIMIFNIDVTEQVLANKQKERLMLDREQAKQEALGRARDLEAIFEAIADPVFIIDTQEGPQRMNRAARELLAVPETVQTAELHTHPRFFELYDEQSHHLPREAWPQEAVFNGAILHGSTAVDVVMQMDDGRRFDLSVTGAPLQAEDGTIKAAVMACRDVTERRRLELRLRGAEQQTRESLQALLILAESLVSAPITGEGADEVGIPASTLEDVARRLAGLIRSVLNCKRVSITILDARTHELRSLAVVGLPVEQEKLWKERRPGFHLSDQVAGASIEAQFTTGNVVVLDMQEPSFNGQPNPYGIKMMLLAPMHIGTRLIGILAIDHAGEERLFTDGEKILAKAVAELAALILERERLLEERAESQANVLALQEANHLKDEFIGIAGHELRTPLTTVKASVQLARRQVARLLKLETTLSPEAQKLISTTQNLLDRAERQVGMQNRLVNDLLDVSRIETGRLELQPELGDLVVLMHEVVEDQQALTPGRRIVFEPSVSEEVLVLVDGDRLRQVMTNYLSNALKYSATDQPVFVRIIFFETEVRVEVEDRGQGLTEAQQQRIWERFYRVPGIEVKSGSGVGLGLGLHISRMIIERHNGHVGVRSVKGQGSIFWLTLPRAE